MSKNHYHGIEVTFIPPSNFREAKLKLTSHRFKKTMSMSWEKASRDVPRNESDDLVTVAESILVKNGYTIVGFAQLQKGYIILVEQFKWEL